MSPEWDHSEPSLHGHRWPHLLNPGRGAEYKSSVAIHPKTHSDLCFHDIHSWKGKINKEDLRDGNADLGILPLYVSKWRAVQMPYNYTVCSDEGPQLGPKLPGSKKWKCSSNIEEPTNLSFWCAFLSLSASSEHVLYPGAPQEMTVPRLGWCLANNMVPLSQPFLDTPFLPAFSHQTNGAWHRNV